MDENSLTTTEFNIKGFNLRRAVVLRELEQVRLELRRNTSHMRVLDFGCGNGLMVKALSETGYDVIGVDVDAGQIRKAREINTDSVIIQSSVFDFNPAETFDVVLSLEVIEHLYDPQKYLDLCHSHLTPGGFLFLSTPYYGYWKNLMLSIFGKWDVHHMPLKLHGHIKLFSMRALNDAIGEAGFEMMSIKRLGRVPAFAMMQFAVARRVG
jgi:ubiquinone biosynthesis O-methyltransferase